MPFVRLLFAVLVVPVSALATITPANVASLVQKWNVTGAGVSGGAVLRDGRLYVGTWDAHVFALDPKTGAKLWSLQVAGAVPGRVLPLDDGGICYGTLAPTGGEVGCLDGATGAVRWQKHVGDPLDGVVWSPPTAFDGTLYVGVAGLPTTRARAAGSSRSTWRPATRSGASTPRRRRSATPARPSSARVLPTVARATSVRATAPATSRAAPASPRSRSSIRPGSSST